MGAVTRALANNIGANGVLVAGAFNNTKSFGNITALPASISAGNLKLLSTTTISTDTTNVDITANIDSTYPIYQFRFINLKVETDGANLQIDFSHNGGSSFGASKTTTFSRTVGVDTSYSYETDKDLHDSSTAQRISHSQGNDSDSGMCGYMWLNNPSSTTFHKGFQIDGIHFQTGKENFYYHCHGVINSTNAVDAVRINCSSGDVTGGIIKLYGLKDA